MRRGEGRGALGRAVKVGEVVGFVEGAVEELAGLVREELLADVVFSDGFVEADVGVAARRCHLCCVVRGEGQRVVAQVGVDSVGPPSADELDNLGVDAGGEEGGCPTRAERACRDLGGVDTGLGVDGGGGSAEC